MLTLVYVAMFTPVVGGCIPFCEGGYVHYSVGGYVHSCVGDVFTLV